MCAGLMETNHLYYCKAHYTYQMEWRKIKYMVNRLTIYILRIDKKRCVIKGLTTF